MSTVHDDEPEVIARENQKIKQIFSENHCLAEANLTILLSVNK